MFYHSIKQGPSSATTKDCLVLKDDDVTHTAIEAKNCLVNMINHSPIDIETTAATKDLVESEPVQILFVILITITHHRMILLSLLLTNT